MKKIIKGRGQGKTTDLIKEAGETGQIVCAEHSVEYIKLRAKEIGVNIKDPICYYEMMRNKYTDIYIDNIEQFLDSVSESQIRAIAINNETLGKPPLGLKPKWLHDEQRLDEVVAAINRYIEAKKLIPQEWMEEYNLLIKTDKRYDRHK